ncbi:MAG: PBSX family phage terminase large subunit [Finegoldia magna]|uniref:PBSX family phage terminase large subunit n=1 Tax=Finegoldia magna TaxID=1260 RepID=UPI0029134A1D|nr:PBSX family phage terminase large subunit [Finegoldia magna]MDU5526984.1 PBSX family phage terminase large subunit [Finegoldia magna]
MISLKTNNIYLPDVVGKGYKTFWNFKGRYRVVKGSRASKKSTTTAMNLIYRIMKYPKSNALVVRKTYRTLQDSCYAQLRWACDRLGVKEYFDFKLSPLEIIYKPSGQKILFRGLDDPLKVTSVTVDVGYLCFLWIEEAYEIMSESDFDMLDESIRGEVPGELFKQITLTLNPWNERHWIKGRFFDREDKETLAITTNYLCNEWLDESDRNVFERMKVHNPRRFQVAGLGNWGIAEGLVYENFIEKSFTLNDVRDFVTVAGLDFGYTNDPTAFFIGFLDEKGKVLYVWDEIYKKGLSNRKIYEEINSLGYAKESITGDSAEPKSIDELYDYGLRIKGAKKGRDSIMNGIQWIQDLKIIIHPRCTNFITEISNYTWDKDRFGKTLNVPVDDFNHLMDAMRYALGEYITGKVELNLFKEGIL